jgi:hypothetical protein
LIALGFIVAIVAASYWIENRNPGKGVPTFFVLALVWSAIYFGPASFLPGEDCNRYSHFAREDC